MTVTFQKRQKEFKRLEKQREKAERRAQKKLDKRAESERKAETPDTGLPMDDATSPPTNELGEA